MTLLKILIRTLLVQFGLNLSPLLQEEENVDLQEEEGIDLQEEEDIDLHKEVEMNSQDRSLPLH